MPLLGSIGHPPSTHNSLSEAEIPKLVQNLDGTASVTVEGTSHLPNRPDTTNAHADASGEGTDADPRQARSLTTRSSSG
jgi:hypothetical protein